MRGDFHLVGTIGKYEKITSGIHTIERERELERESGDKCLHGQVTGRRKRRRR